MAAQQRHDGAAVLGHRKHRRLGLLVAQQRCQRADQNARRANPDNRRAGREERLKVRDGASVLVVRRHLFLCRGMDRGAGQRVFQALGEGKRAWPQYDDGGL